MPEIQIKKKLAAGKPVTILSGDHTADFVEFLAQLGPDGIWIECEHGPTDWSEISDMSRACDLWGLASICRVNANEPWLIGRTLDRGASGIVVPHVSTKAAAEQVVEAAYYAPVGERGMAAPRRSFGVPDYYNRANDETLTVILIEEIEAVRNLAEILTVDHVDVFFVAPTDLAQTMGYIGNHKHPDVQAVLEQALKQIVAAGKTAGTLVTDDDVDRFLDLGTRFLYTRWPNWVAQGGRQFLGHVNGRFA